MEGFCRGCLVHYEEADLHQYTEASRRLFVYSTGLQVKRNDKFPFQLCKNCYWNMRQASRFKKQCRGTEKKLMQYLALKESGENISLLSFLRTNDTGKLPSLDGSSTPVYQPDKDDDNVSTCTSIRNFMSELVHDVIAEDMPDEARIIREVIEEEADLLDDTLDSHWLGETTQNEMGMDFSFSGFSTPRSYERDHNYTPHKLDTSSQEKINDYAQKITQYCERLITHTQKEKTLNTIKELEENPTGNILKDPVKDFRQVDFQKELLDHDFEKRGKFYVENSDVKRNDQIDRNIEKALRDGNEEYLIADIIKTPEVQPGVSTLSTPTINNILFGDVNIDLEPRLSPKPDLDTTDILEDFFKPQTPKTPLESTEFVNKITKEITKDKLPEEPITDDRCDLEKSYCNLCSKKFFNEKSLRLHFHRFHNSPIKIPAKKDKRKLCDICGKDLRIASYLQHYKRHLRPDASKEYTCDTCGLKFSGKAKITHHIKTVHLNIKVKRTKKVNTKHICEICGACTKTNFALKMHRRTHLQDYSHECNYCGKGFYKKADMEMHVRLHTGERPHQCIHCDAKFRRRDTLNNHIKMKHSGEKRFRCSNCSWRFATEDGLKRHYKTKKGCYVRTLHLGKKLIQKDPSYMIIDNKITNDQNETTHELIIGKKGKTKEKQKTDESKDLEETNNAGIESGKEIDVDPLELLNETTADKECDTEVFDYFLYQSDEEMESG